MACKSFRDNKHRDEVVSKIQKLLSVVDGNCFEAEAATAMRMAKMMMVQYGLHMSDVEMRAAAKNVVEMRTDHEGRIHPWEQLLSGVIEVLCDVKALLTRQGRASCYLTFVGMKDDVELAIIIYSRLFDTISRMAWLNYDRKTQRNSYAMGMCFKLRRRAEDETRTAKQDVPIYGALVVLKEKEIDDFIHESFGDVKSQRQSVPELDAHAVSHGMKDADRLDLSRSRKIGEPTEQEAGVVVCG